jgi:hypothetical protein
MSLVVQKNLPSVIISPEMFLLQRRSQVFARAQPVHGIAARSVFLRVHPVLAGRKGYLFPDEVLIDFPGVLSLATCNILCEGMQCILCWIKPIAEHISQLTFPGGTHFYGCEHWELFFRRKLLQFCDCIHTIMIGDGDQAKGSHTRWFISCEGVHVPSL